MSASIYAKCGVAGRLATLAAAYTIGFVAKFQDCCGVCMCVLAQKIIQCSQNALVVASVQVSVCVTHPTILNETHVSMGEACSSVFAAHWATLE